MKLSVAAEQTQESKNVIWTKGRDINASHLGGLFDTWADVLDDEGERAEKIKTLFQARMQQRETPKVALESCNLVDGGISSGSIGRIGRRYFVGRTHTGAVVTVRISKFGKDLYLSFNVFVRPVLNALVICLTFGLMLAGLPLSLFGIGIPILLLGVGLTGLFLLAGFAFAGKASYYFYRTLSIHDAEDIRAVTIAIHNTLKEVCEVAGIKKTLRPKSDFSSTKSRGI